MIAAEVPALSRARVQQLLAGGAVTVDGQVVTRPASRVAEGAQVVVAVPDPVTPEDGPAPQDLPLTVLHADAAIIVLAKPAGMAVHPAPGTPDGTVVNVLLHRFPDLPGIGGERRPGIVHRLDKGTTGVMVVARTEAALRALQAQFKAREVEKIYQALVHGVPRQGEGVLDTAFARHPRDRKRFTAKGVEGRKDARRAVTRWKVVETFDHAARLEVRLLTGRTHQIRVHLTEAGHPLLGDKVYGGGRRDRTSPSSAVREAAARLGHQGLHAWRLSFDHPDSGARMTFEAPLPPEWEAALAALRA